MVGGMTGVLKDIIPFGLSYGNRNYLKGLNLIGLRRNKYENKIIIELDQAYKKIFSSKNLHVNLIAIKNKFYGESVTVSGLLTGRDIINQLKDEEIGNEIWISHRILNDEGICTLDDMTLQDISSALQHPIRVGEDSFHKLLIGINNV